jgi:hypothetical protein
MFIKMLKNLNFILNFISFLIYKDKFLNSKNKKF